MFPIDTRRQTAPEPARQVVNLVFQLIESQIDINLPVPAVEPPEEEDEAERRHMIEGQLSYMAGDTTLRRINSENERIVKKNGLAYFKVGWNPDYKGPYLPGQESRQRTRTPAISFSSPA